MKFLFVVPPLTGHVNPTVSVARALAHAGHEVAWAAHAATVARLLPSDARLIPLDESVSRDLVEAAAEKALTLRGAAALKFLWEDFLVPLARHMRPGVDAAVAEYAPDVVVVDQQAIAGALVARRRGLPWATLATTSAGVMNPLAGMPQVDRWEREQLAGLAAEAGLDLSESIYLSSHLVIAFTTAAMVGPLDRFPPHYRFVGPSISDRPEPTEFPWEALHEGPRILVSMGTVNAEASRRFYSVVIEGLADMSAQVILVAPPDIVDPESAPANFLVRGYVPQLALLSHVSMVVSHAGHNTVCEALAHGLPLVVAPIKDDQPIIADQVVAAGAGLRVKFGRVQPTGLRAAVEQVLNEPSFRAGAERVRASFAAAGGATAAAGALIELGEQHP